MISFLDRFKFAIKWSKITSLAAKSEYQSAYGLTSKVLKEKRYGSKYINLLLMHVRLCAHLKKNDEAVKVIEIFFDRLFEVGLNIYDISYLAAYAASCNEIVSARLGYKNKYLKFLETETLVFNKVSDAYKRNFSPELIENIISLLKKEEVDSLYPENF